VKLGPLLLSASLLLGCVREAVLENDVRSAEWKARTLATATDLDLAYAALAAQLVELEALYQRAPADVRVRRLLERGYVLLAWGFIELRRVEAIASGDGARAEEQKRLQGDALRRAHFYAGRTSERARLSEVERVLGGPGAACRAHDQATYERLLHEALAQKAPSPETHLEFALTRTLAALWLSQNLAARCGFPASP
jgi:hypothetical protein